MNKKVLIFAYDYPPRGWSGVQRTVKFVRYMSNYGWEPIVVAPSDWYMPGPLDYSFVEEVANAITIRTRAFTRGNWSRPAHVLWKGLKPFLSPLGKNEQWLVEGLRWRMESTLFPDAGVTWLPFAVREGLKAVRRYRPEVIYATAPPYSTLLSAWIVAKISRVPFVADLRDLWVDNPLRIIKSRIKKKIDKLMESAVLSNAAAIVTTTRAGADLLRKKYGRETEHVFTLYNGYDEKDFSFDRGSQKPEWSRRERIISHIGSLYGDISPAPFLKGLAAFLQMDSRIQESLSVRFVGEFSQFMDVFKDYQHLGVLELKEAVDHNLAVEIMKNSDVLLLIQAEGHKKVIPGKVFEYFASGRPILGIVPLDGEIANLLRQYGNAWVVGAGDVEGISSSLDEIYKKWHQGYNFDAANQEYVRKFERKALTSQMCDIFTFVSAPTSV